MKVLRMLTAAALISAAACAFSVSAYAQTRYMENLDRGAAAMKTSEGMLITWRLLGSEPYDTSFAVYRDGEKIAETELTNYLDTDGSLDSAYRIAPIYDGVEGDLSDWTIPFEMGSNYFDIPIEKPDPILLPGAETEKSYSVSDATCGDCDGDGEYEIILMWTAGESDNSNSGYTGNVIIDSYKLDGTRLWRIDLGKNIRAGAHYVQMMAADFNSDGKCELALKTAPGSIDGNGNYVTEASLDEAIRSTDNSADYRGSDGRVIQGPEFFTVFAGDDGAAIDTIAYPIERGNVEDWGDSWGNRVDRFLGCSAYLDGEKPSIVTWRGYYTRMVAVALDLVDGRLVERCRFDTNEAGDEYMHQGNHSILAADVDNDGKDEVISGAICLDDDFSILWCSFRMHGDAHHIGWYSKEQQTPIYFSVHEVGEGEKPDGTPLDYGMTVYDAATGEELYHASAEGDTPRGMMGNFGMGGDYQFWSIGGGGYIHTDDGFVPADTTGSSCFRIFWDGDMYDELFDGRAADSYAQLTKYSQTGGYFYEIMNTKTTGGVVTGSTKKYPVLQADLFGDWREEFILKLYGDSAIRVYTSNIYTENKLYTLMHDSTYRNGVVAENVGYNQPPHIGYYVSEDGDDNRTVQPDIKYAAELPDKEIPDEPPIEKYEPDPNKMFDFEGSLPSTNEIIICGSKIGNITTNGVWKFSGAPYGYLAAANEYHASLRAASGFVPKDGNLLVFASNGKSAGFTAQHTEKAITESGVIEFDISYPVSFSDNGVNSRGNNDSIITAGDGTTNIIEFKFVNSECALYLNGELFYQFENAQDAQNWHHIYFDIDKAGQKAYVRLDGDNGAYASREITLAEAGGINTFKVYTEGKWGFVAMDNFVMYEKDDVLAVFETKCSIKEVAADKITVDMISEAGGTAQLLIAAYNKGTLIKTAAFDTELKTGTKELPFELPNEADTVKFFVWNNNTPLSRTDIKGVERTE